MPLRDVGRLTAYKTIEQAPKSRAFRRIQGTRKMLGTKMGKNSKDGDIRISDGNDTIDVGQIDIKKAEVSVL